MVNCVKNEEQIAAETKNEKAGAHARRVNGKT